MKLTGHSDLDQLASLPTSLRSDLRAHWVESVEEWLGLVAALEAAARSSPETAKPAFAQQATMAAVRAQALTLVGVEPATALAEGRPGGALGCEIPAEVLQQFRTEHRVSPRRAAAPQGLTATTLPGAVRLTNQLPAVRNQGSRGTCVAFSTVALREYLETGRPRLSEQFLYWACKELDGRDSPGTSLHTAMSSLSQYGCCLESTWPYDPAARPGNESHQPPPIGAIEDARRFRMPDCRTVEPSWMDQYRRILAGQDDVRPMPVVVGVLVFASWFYSPAVHRSGKITLPFPGEEPVGGHAMCIVGYVDDPSAPGGGYFIVRNSWGVDWAAASPEAPGHAMMPYAYFEAYCMAAFTGPAVSRSEMPVTQDPEWKGYIRVLTRETRDLDGLNGQGRLLKAGTKVLFHPAAPDEVMEDTETNRKRFFELDRAWTVGTRQRVWFTPVARFQPSTHAAFDAVRANQKRFLGAIEDNLRNSVGTPFPYWKSPAWAFLVPYEWEPKVEAMETAVDLTAPLVEALQRHTGVRPDLPWPDDWTAWMREHNRFLVVRLSRGSSCAHVGVIHLTPVECRPGSEPRLGQVTRALLDAAEAVYHHWRGGAGVSPETRVFFSIAIEGPIPPHLEVPASDGLLEILVSYQPDGTWVVPPPRQENGRLSLRDFLDRLKPETHEQRLARLRKVIDTELDEYAGNVGEMHIRRKTGARRSQIRDAFFHLQRAHPDRYRVKPMAGDEWCIQPRTRDTAGSLTEVSAHRRAIRRHVLGLTSLTIGALLATGHDWLRTQFGLPWWAATAMGVIIAYVGQIIQKAINERAERGRD